MTDALTGSQRAELAHQRHLKRAEVRAERLAGRRDEILTAEFLQAALTTKAGLRHVHAAVHLHARGNVGGLTTRQLRDALQAVFSTKTRSK